MSLRGFVVALVALAAVACAHAAPTASRAVVATGTPTASPSPSVASPSAGRTQAAFNCPVTVPNGSDVPWGEEPSPLHHGNGKLWTVLWPNETVLIPYQNIDEAGVLWMKFPWWRGPGVSGRLQVVGTRLDATAPPLKFQMSDYGPIGFQASSLGFSSEGCWEVTGTAGAAKLTFVTRVVESG